MDQDAAMSDRLKNSLDSPASVEPEEAPPEYLQLAYTEGREWASRNDPDVYELAHAAYDFFASHGLPNYRYAVSLDQEFRRGVRTVWGDKTPGHPPMDDEVVEAVETMIDHLKSLPPEERDRILGQ